MRIPFTTNEIRSTVQNLKTNKSHGGDGIPVKLFKHVPEAIYEKNTDTFNSLLCNVVKWLVTL